MKQVKTTKIKGNVDYAKVADRLLEFRSQNPRSKISIKYSYDEAGNLTHTARIWKDKTECYELLKAGVNAEAIAESADAEASAFMFAEQLKKEKGFEKNESIAVGRALAILGYAVSGEIASSEEMEEFDENDIITLTDEEGNQIQALYLDTIEFEEQVYAALMTMQSDESGEILIFRIEDSEYEDMDDYVTVEDERILEAVYEIVKERFGDELSFTD